MEIKCKNCEALINGNFCSNCGQSANIHRISWHYLWHDIQHGFFHVDKGILFTVKELFTRPGHTIREFLQGKRVKHFKPISLMLILAGIYGFLYHYFHYNLTSTNISLKEGGSELMATKLIDEKIKNLRLNYYSIFAMCQLPFLSIATYLCFRKVKYNLVEHLIIHSFLISQQLVLSIVCLPIFKFIIKEDNLGLATKLVDTLGYVICVLSLSQLFKELSKLQSIIRGILSLIVAAIILMFSLLVSMLIVIFLIG